MEESTNSSANQTGRGGAAVATAGQWKPNMGPVKGSRKRVGISPLWDVQLKTHVKSTEHFRYVFNPRHVLKCLAALYLLRRHSFSRNSRSQKHEVGDCLLNAKDVFMIEFVLIIVFIFLFICILLKTFKINKSQILCLPLLVVCSHYTV